MKPQDLMVGDWVQNPHGLKGRVRSIKYIPKDNADNYGGYSLLELVFSESTQTFPISVQTFPINDAKPIPITPEILEKNGFVQNPRSKSRRSHQICTDSVYISWWRGRLNILFKPFIGHSTNHVNVDGKYVHELQHALRICGIEKEIVL